MDPREERSARLLRETLFEMARTRDISNVTAVELSLATGLSRRTIYNHGQGPRELLFGYLAEELTAIREEAVLQARDHSASEGFAAGLQRVLDHVQNNRAIYTHAVSASASPAWHHLLTQHFAVSLARYTALYSPTAPIDEAMGADLGPAADHLVCSAIAHAMVGAIEAWLRLDGQPDPEICFRLILAVTPEWFLRPREQHDPSE